ncbi:hypothetical protein BH20ACT13_BH20ACT13_15850 [soil metagenome]
MMRPLLGLLTVVVAAAAAVETSVRDPRASAAPRSVAMATTPHDCPRARVSSRYVKRVNRALNSRRDSWGARLLAAPDGPTYERAERFLTPLLLARAKNGRLLTDSGVHYTHFSQPPNLRGATSVGLHVADGSQIISRRSHGRHLTVAVGAQGRERYGSCLPRLRGPTLSGGHLPILQTRYFDRHGVRYRQESFAVRIPETRSLVSFISLTADARRSRATLVRLRFTPSAEGLQRSGQRLVRDGRTFLFFAPGGSYGRPSIKYGVRRGEIRTVYVAWLHTPRSSEDLTLDELRYQEARDSVRRYWERRLAHGAVIDVPEQRVVDAQRNLLIQNLALTWRYSVGNRYEQLSTPEGVDVARVLASYGHLGVSRAILRTSLRKRPALPKARTVRRSTNWRMGARLVGFAHYARVSGDRAAIIRATPALRAYVNRLGRQIRSNRKGLLNRERYSSDVSASVYGLHSQAVAWQGLRSMGQVWQETGYTKLAATCRRLARRLEGGLRRAVRRSARRQSGALFVPVALLDGERPYRSLTASRNGSYWNLVMPYALASGFFQPHGAQAKGLLAYLNRSGSRLLGRVRAGAYSLYGRGPAPARSASAGSGFSPVYGLNMARFLANNDRPAQLVLSLYGQLAAEMTPGTFVSGESVSVAPLRGDHFRSTYLPPNGASNASFLETLRLMLVHETTDRTGTPRGLELAHATPRTWLDPGKRIEVRRMATSFGRVSFAIEAGADSARVSIDVPERAPLAALRLRLRLPGGKRISEMLRDGLPYGRVLEDGETLALPPVPGALELEVRFS